MLWVELLNRALEWAGPSTAVPQALLETAGTALDAKASAQLTRDLSLLRAVHAARALPRAQSASENDALSQWLDAVTLEFASTPRKGPMPLPALRARRPRSALPPALEELVCTALVELLAAGPAAASVQRCHGVVRAADGRDPTEDDRRFAQAAGVERLLDAGWRQCPQLVWAPRRGRYCSKACSNAAFALRKGSADPRYFARKQARYRARLSVPERPRPSAFVAFTD